MDVSKLANIAVRCAKTGEKVQMSSFWKDQACVIHFMRRFGCAFCRLGARDMSSIHPQLKENNVRLVGIAHEELGLKEFEDGKYFSGEIFLDDSKANYEAIGFKRYSLLGVLGSLVSRVALSAMYRANKEGVSGNMAGDGLQTGGTLVVEKGGRVLLDFRQENPADQVDLASVLKALKIPADEAGKREEAAA